MKTNCPNLEFRKTAVGISEGSVQAKGLKAKYGDLVEILDHQLLRGHVIGIDNGIYLIEVFGDTAGLDTNIGIRETLKPPTVRVSPYMFGRIWTGLMEPADGGPPIMGGEEISLNLRSFNPIQRKVPSDLLITGFSGIDVFTSIVKGQKIALMSSPGVEVMDFIGHLIHKTIQNNGRNFSVVAGLIGADDTEIKNLWHTIQPVQDQSVLFVHRKGDPAGEGLLVPRAALAVAQHLWIKQDQDVLVILHDLTRYGEILREISSMRGELAIRKGYPSYMFSDFASMLEQCGVLKNRPGSLTLLPSLILPGDDLEHPIPDTVGYITEGQILLRKDLQDQGIFPPFDIINSLSRLMHHAAGQEHRKIASEIYKKYAHGKLVQEMESLMGGGESEAIGFVRQVEKKLLKQPMFVNRPLSRSLRTARQILEGEHAI